MAYKIVRFFFRGQNRTIKTVRTLEEAKAHCTDPETSSSTCTKARNKLRTKRFGAWFDGWQEA